MRQSLSITVFLVLVTGIVHTQNIRLSGNSFDTTTKQPLANVLLMAIKFSDSTLIGSSRSNSNGNFKPLKLKPDTFIVILSHPNFGDKTYLLVPTPKDTSFNLKNVILPPKSLELNEVEVIAYRDKTYYKGDTLVFTADSFKTRPNATVEDLLKKLPGVRVDAQGKITVQGKQVDQVLVDGDEFFGSDPTIATRNLNAAAVENVQVYEKKNENTEEGQSESLKVVNLKLKDDAKKGYFGKVSGAADFTQFYENELLLNKFKGNRKASVFGLVANTPKQAFGWGDIDKYGLEEEQAWIYDDESDSWTNNNNERTGIPQTIKGGFYFSDKFGKNIKLNTDYSYNQRILKAGKETNTQFFLQDTSYTNSAANNVSSNDQNHAFNLRLVQKLDSLTELVLVPKVRYNLSNNSSNRQDDFISQNNELTRRTTIYNNHLSESSNLDVKLRLKRNFNKKDRNISLNYQPIYSSNTGSTNIITTNEYFLNQETNTSLKLKRKQNGYKMEHYAQAVYVEPWTEKFKTELNYNVSVTKNNAGRNSYDYSGGTDIFDSTLSNNFENQRVTNRAGIKFIYDVKKYRVIVGSSFRNVEQQNINLSNRQKLRLSVNNVLPAATFNYRINPGSNFWAQYSATSELPDIKQMQPVIDNSNLNNVSIGNPNLKPTFRNNVNINYYFYKGISDINLYAGINANNTYNRISNTTVFDAQGKTFNQPVNVSGNYYTNMYLGGGVPLFKRFLKLYYNINASNYQDVSLVNGVKNISKNSNVSPNITIEKESEFFEVGINGKYEYNLPTNNLNAISTQPYYTYGMGGNFLLKLPKIILVEVNGNYTNSGNRTPGYNLNYFILNASIRKIFLKNENLIVSIEGNDLLNQNINNKRFITGNQIVDEKTTVIQRYFLLKVVLKLNSQKTKEDNDEYD